MKKGEGRGSISKTRVDSIKPRETMRPSEGVAPGMETWITDELFGSAYPPEDAFRRYGRSVGRELSTVEREMFDHLHDFGVWLTRDDVGRVPLDDRNVLLEKLRRRGQELRDAPKLIAFASKKFGHTEWLSQGNTLQLADWLDRGFLENYLSAFDLDPELQLKAISTVVSDLASIAAHAAQFDTVLDAFDVARVLYQQADGLEKKIERVCTDEERATAKRAMDRIQEYAQAMSNIRVTLLVRAMVRNENALAGYERRAYRGSNEQEEKDRYRAAIARSIAGTGVDLQRLMEAWRGVTSRYTERFGTTPENVGAMIALNDRRPGSPGVLHAKYGITHFSRYDTDLLVEQVDRAADQTMPYGVLAYPIADWNGAFGMNKQSVSDLRQQLDSLGYGLRIVEVGNKRELAHRLLSLRRDIPDVKPSFLVLGGHGTPTSIQLGDWGKGKMIGVEDIVSSGALRLGSLFVGGASVVLASCSTGVPGGIGQRLAETHDACVTAPVLATNIQQFSAMKETNGRLVVSVAYLDAGAERTYSGKKRS